MSSTNEKLKTWFLIPTKMETQPEMVSEAAQNDNQAQVTPFQL